jgi:hypothetical protein
VARRDRAAQSGGLSHGPRADTTATTCQARQAWREQSMRRISPIRSADAWHEANRCPKTARSGLTPLAMR